MRLRVRPYLMAGVAVVAAGGISLPSTVTPHAVPAARHDSVALTAQNSAFDVLPSALITVRPPAPSDGPTELPKLLSEALAAAPAATPTVQASALAFPGLSNAIIGAYDVIMPWVDWGVNTAVYAVGWIPVVNWFTPQIDIFYYDLIRPIITSAVFNIAYWVGGIQSFGQGLTNFFNDTVAAGGLFIDAQIDWLLSFLPPLPPFFPFAAASEAVMAVQGARTAVQIPAPEKPAESTVEEEPTATEPTESTEPAVPVEPQPEPETELVPEPEAPQPPADVTDPEPETAPEDTTATDEKDPEESGTDETEDSETKDSEDAQDAETPADKDDTEPATTKPADNDKDADTKDSDTKPGKPADNSEKNDKADKADKAAKASSDS
ncbi:hypothetical protein [Mycobacterium sp. C31M]